MLVLLKRRSKVVTFRVFVDEFESLNKACLSAGARSLSEFARMAVLNKVKSPNAQSGTLSGDLTTLSKSLSELDLLLRDARGKIRGVLGKTGDNDRTA